MIKKIIIAFLSIIGVGIILGITGPKPSFEKVDNTPSSKVYDIQKLDDLIEKREASVANIKPDNQARIVWADSTRTKTEYSVVYLHGFSASQGEGFPMHLNIADSLGANLYLPRFSGHGISDSSAMKDLTPKLLVEEAKDALAIARTIGEKVIILSCSTGSTLGIYLAANDPSIEGLVLLSPNIEVAVPEMKLLTGPWGKQLAYQMIGPTRHITGGIHKPYWSDAYSTNGLIALQALLDMTMKPEIFEDINAPIYCGYFYKNEEVQDRVVSVDAMLAFQKELTIPAEDMEFEAFPEAGDHVICSKYKSESWKDVQDEVWDFIKREIITE